jgi:hypothetical protein
MKQCTKCGKTKELSEFHKDKRYSTGVRPDCKECKREQNRKGYRENKAERMAYKERYYHEVQKHNPQWRVGRNFSRSVNAALNGVRKNKPTFEALGYTLDELVKHLESQFDDAMTWENYGSYWDVDHIYPQSKLPYDTLDHPNFKRCWSLDNLQPLEKSANQSKGNRIL